MKKTLLLPLLLTALFTSCIFYPAEDYSKIRGKTSYKSFDSLNEPIVLNYDFVMNFATKGKNPKENFVNNGTIYAIYDWESNTVFDYVYAPGEYSDSMHNPFNMCLKGTDGKLSFYGYDPVYEKIYVMRSDKTRLTSFASDDKNSYWCRPGFGNPAKIISGKGLRYYSNEYEYGEYLFKVKTFSPDSDSFGTVVSEKITGINQDAVSVSDADGNYWFVFGHAGEGERNFSKICRFNVEKNAFDSPIAEFDENEGAVFDEEYGWDFARYFTILTVDSDYVYFSEEIINLASQKIFRIKKTGGTPEEIVNPVIAERVMLTVQNVNGKIYVFLKKPILNEVNVFRLNDAGTGLDEINGLSFKSEEYACPVVRGEKIFFVSNTDQVSKMICVDLDKNTVTIPEPVALKDILK